MRLMIYFVLFIGLVVIGSFIVRSIFTFLNRFPLTIVMVVVVGVVSLFALAGFVGDWAGVVTLVVLGCMGVFTVRFDNRRWNADLEAKRRAQEADHQAKVDKRAREFLEIEQRLSQLRKAR